MPRPSSDHLISRVRDFCRWQERLFGDPSAQGVPSEDPPGWATGKEFWIRNTVWRETIFEGNPGDSSAAADALIAVHYLAIMRSPNMDRRF
jgi:hypothetical protein